jgi:hypothetical protein
MRTAHIYSLPVGEAFALDRDLFNLVVANPGCKTANKTVIIPFPLQPTIVAARLAFTKCLAEDDTIQNFLWSVVHATELAQLCEEFMRVETARKTVQSLSALRDSLIAIGERDTAQDAFAIHGFIANHLPSPSRLRRRQGSSWL